MKPGEWVRGRGWDEGKLAERRYITAADLDTVAPNNPVWLTQTTGHYGVANTYALKMAEVRRDTKDPPAGTIDRDAQGNPTGVLKESAQGLVTADVPPLTRDQQKRGIQQIVEDFNREGMTGAKDPGIGEQKWELYQELLKEGRLTVRVFALWAGPRQASRHRGGDGAGAEAAQAADLVRRRPADVWWREAVHGRQRRRPHGMDVRGLEQGRSPTATPATRATRRRRRRTTGRSSRPCTRPAFTSARTRSAIAPSTGWWTPTIRS